jgi:outer membrane lipoprotein-sorting protein
LEQLNKQSLTLVCLLLLILFVSNSCSTIPKYDDVSTAQWNSRALLRDKGKKKTQVIYVGVLAAKPNRVRFDFTTSLGMQVGTLVANDSEFSLLMIPQKQFTTGKANSNTISRILPVPVSPQLMTDALFEVEPKGTDWSCTRDKNDLLKECSNNQSRALISWSNRQGSRRTLSFSDKSFEVQLELMEFKPNVQVQDAQFELKAPPGFHVRKL